ncbi:hypothetical protein EDC32_10916 [Laceyella sacchari]|jgi:hypothetical protein|nr:hypothetical protein EDC32_10916 [Laceyella sacchari]
MSIKFVKARGEHPLFFYRWIDTIYNGRLYHRINRRDNYVPVGRVTIYMSCSGIAYCQTDGYLRAHDGTLKYKWEQSIRQRLPRIDCPISLL